MTSTATEYITARRMHAALHCLAELLHGADPAVTVALSLLPRCAVLKKAAVAYFSMCYADKSSNNNRFISHKECNAVIHDSFAVGAIIVPLGCVVPHSCTEPCTELSSGKGFVGRWPAIVTTWQRLSVCFCLRICNKQNIFCI